MGMPLRTATSRLIAIHLLLVSLSTAMVLGFVYLSTKSVIEREVREVVEAEIRGLADDYATGGVLGLARAINRRLAADATHDAVYLLTGRDGRPITGNLAEWPPTIASATGWTELELYRTDRERPAFISATSIRLPGGERLLVGRDAQARAIFNRTLVRALVWGLGASGMLALFSGWLLSRFVGRRLADVVSTAEELVQGDMARRVPVRGVGDEFDQLAATLNRMLDRIEQLVGDLRMVTDSMAHDLRSPLTRLRTHLDASLDDALDADARHDRIGAAIAEADGILRVFTALLDIARAEAGVGRDQFEIVDLDALAGDVVDLFGPTAEERGVNLALRGKGAKVSGHPQLLANALANLIENALRHAPSGSEVAVELSSEPGSVSLSVADHGVGVSAEDRERILGRFVRLDGSRGSPGAGLGLSLVAAVARMHGADLALEDNAPGLRARMRFASDGGPTRRQALIPVRAES